MEIEKKHTTKKADEEERKTFEIKAEAEAGNDRLRYYVKPDVLWNARYTFELKKLPDFHPNAVEIQRIARGYLTRKNMHSTQSNELEIISL